jgi:hypothetical protein
MNHTEKRSDRISEHYLKYIRRDEAVDRVRLDGGVGIHHEQILIERRVHTNDVLDLVVHLELERVHRCVEMDLTIGMNGSSSS